MRSKANKFLFLLVACVCFLSVGAVGVCAQKIKTSNAKTRFVHEPDLRKLLPKFLTAQGFLDPKFAEAIAKPSPYLTDFYGIQALADTTKENIKRDFVPTYAEIIAEDENTIELKFKNGYTGKFYPHSTLKIMGATEVPHNHVEISGATWAELLKNLEDFRGILRANRWEKRYLIPNPFYREELVVAGNLNGNVAPAEIVVSPTLAEMQREKNAVLIYPEGVHGDTEAYKKFDAEVLTKHQFDWVGLEMLAPAQQKDLDVFAKAAADSLEYKSARRALIDYFASAWNGRRGAKTTGEENYYFKIVDTLRTRKTVVIGIETTTAAYLIFRYGENKFGGAVRSLQWAKALPKTGKGMVFGGSAHFNDSQPINFQDFLKIVNPKAKIFALAPIKMRQPMK